MPPPISAGPSPSNRPLLQTPPEPPRSRASSSPEASVRAEPEDLFKSHTATVNVTRAATRAQVRAGAERVAAAVMTCIGSYDKHYLLNTDGLKADVAEVAGRVLLAASTADEAGSAAERLSTRFPGAKISLVGTASKAKLDAAYYVVTEKNGTVHNFAEGPRGGLTHIPNASGLVFMRTDLTPGATLKVRVPEVRFLIDPLSPPGYGVGRTVAVINNENTDKQKRNAGDSVTTEFDGLQRERLPGKEKGEDGQPLSQMLYGRREEKGVIVKYNDNHTYDVNVTHPDGTQSVQTLDENALRSDNDPQTFNLNGSTYDDVSVDVNQDASLAAFIVKAKAIGDRDIIRGGTPEEIAESQKKALVDLTLLCNAVLSYPDEDKATRGDADKAYDELANSHSNNRPMKLGELIDVGRGVCRHQAILMQVACQTVGIPSRLLAATANTPTNEFRGYHAFLETELDDGKNYLTDPTWFDAGPSNVQGRTQYGPQYPDKHTVQGTPYFDTLYFNARRQVIPDWSQNDQNNGGIVNFQENNDPVIDANGKVVVKPVDPPHPPQDIPKLMTSVRTTLFHQDYKDWWGQDYDPSTLSAKQWLDSGNKDLSTGNQKSAVSKFSLGIQFGKGMTPDLTKTIWKALNDGVQSLSALDGMPEVAKNVQDAFNALPA